MSALLSWAVTATLVMYVLAMALGLARLVRHEEADFVLECWSSDARSVAQAEGLT